MRGKSREIAVSGLAAALGIVLMFAATYMRVSTVAFLFLTAILTAIVLVETNAKYAVGCFVATSLLSVLLVPDKTVVLLYVLFFGWYALLKLLAETRKSRVLEWTIKLGGFHIALVLCSVLFFLLFHVNILEAKLSIWLLWPMGVVLFVLLDVLLSFGIHFYLRKRNK